MKQKNRFRVDDENRLVIKRGRESLIADGRFSIDKNNRLIYWLNEPVSWRRVYGLPGKIRFIGNWKLNPNSDLELILDETSTQNKGDCLVLKGEIISTDRDSLVFQMKGLSLKGTVPEREDLIQFYLLKLSGSWQVDEHNRISFTVKRKTEPDILVLEGKWQMNENQQITYAYEKTDLKRKTKSVNTLTFEGFWQINTSNRLTYILSCSSGSCFDFRVQAESPNLYPQQGVIKYRLGIGLKQKRERARIISLYGAWKFSRKLGLIFQMDYAQGRINNIEFQGDISVGRRNKINISLSNKRGEPLGLNIAFTHRFLKKLDAEAFLRLKEILQDKPAVEVGVRIPF